MPYTTADLLSDIKRDDFFSSSQTFFTDAELLDIGNGELLAEIIPMIKTFNENYYMELVDSSFVANQSSYALPKYGMWNVVFLVQRINQSGIAIYPDFVRLELDQLKDYQVTNTGVPNAYYILNDTINFVPTPGPGVTDRYRLWIYRRPGRMVPTSFAAQVQSVNLATGEVTYTAVPPATYTASSRHDFYSSTPPFRRLQTDIQATAILGNVQTFPVASVQNLVAGDYVCIVDETVYPPIPLEIQPYLSEIIIKMVSKSRTDAQTYNLQKEKS
jgi:hypothetical protein